MKNALLSLGLACGIVPVLALLPSRVVEGAVKERVYTFDDAGAVAGQLPGIIAGGTRRGTNDTQPSTTDYGGVDPPSNANNSFVPLIGSGNTVRIPLYASATDRPGALAGNLGLQFDGIDDTLYTALPAQPTVPYVFDPRDFNNSFEVVSQAWVKPTSASFSALQYVWRIGDEHGGAYISANGKWGFQTGNDTPPFQIESNVAVQPNVWTHVTIFRGGNVSYFYINGAIVGRDAQFWGHEGPDLRLGSDLLAAGSFFKGIVDNFNIGTLSDDTFNAAIDIDYFHDIGQNFSNVRGDVNQDGVVNASDYQIWSQHLGFDNGFGLGDPTTLLQGDVDQSGVIDLYDYQIIRTAALASGNGSAVFGVVPEPTSLVLVLAGVACLAATRRGSRQLTRSLSVVLTTFAVGFLVLNGGSSARASVVVAEDFFYDGPSKTEGVGGGFNGYEVYQGGENGTAGAWNGRWGNLGDGIVVTNQYVPKSGTDTNTPPYVGLLDGDMFGPNSILQRSFTLSGSLPSTQTLYFGGKFKADLVIDPIPQFYAPRLFLNRIRGEDRLTAVPQRDRSKDIALGFEENNVIARLGASGQNQGNEVHVPVAANAPDDGNWHFIIGKLEVNAVGNNERLTVWIDPTGVETGGTTAQIQADIMTDNTQLLGTFDGEATAPYDPQDPELGRTYVDDIAIGTTWQDVATVSVPRLTLQVNRTNDSAKLINSTSSSFQLDGYSLESVAGSLNSGGWSSLDDQNVSDWQENLATTHRLAETAFTGSTTLGAGGQLSLGQLFTTNSAEDLTGRISTTDGLVNLLNVQFVTAPVGVVGDYNNNGIVDAGDYVVWRRALGSAVALPNRDPANSGNISQADYNSWRKYFGQTAGSGSWAVGAIPEPSSLCLLLTAIVGSGLFSGTKRTGAK